MPVQIKQALIVELFLVILTLLFLLRPKLFFKPVRSVLSESGEMAQLLNWVGVVLFCLMFVWSVVLGVLIQLGKLAGWGDGL